MYPSMRLDDYIPYQPERRIMMDSPEVFPGKVGPSEFPLPDGYNMYDVHLGYIPIRQYDYNRPPLNYYVRPAMANVISHRKSIPVRQTIPWHTPLENEDFEYTVPIHDEQDEEIMILPTVLPTIDDTFTYSHLEQPTYAEINVPKPTSEGRKHLEDVYEMKPTETTTGDTTIDTLTTSELNDRERKLKAIEIIIQEIREKLDKEDYIDDEAKENINRFLNELEEKINKEKNKPDNEEQNDEEFDEEHKKSIIYIQKIIDDLEKKKQQESMRILLEPTTTKTRKEEEQEVTEAEENAAMEDTKSGENFPQDNDEPQRKSNNEFELTQVSVKKPEKLPESTTTSSPTIPTTTNSSKLSEETHRKVNVEESTEVNHIERTTTTTTPLEATTKSTDSERRHMIAEVKDDTEDHTETLVLDHNLKMDIFEETHTTLNEQEKTTTKMPESIEITTPSTTAATPVVTEARRINLEDSPRLTEMMQPQQPTEETEDEEEMKNTGGEVLDISEVEEIETPRLDNTPEDLSTADNFSAESMETTRGKAFHFYDIFSNLTDAHLPPDKLKQLDKLRKLIVYLYFRTNKAPKDHYKIGLTALKWFDTVNESPTEQDKINFLKHWLRNNKLEDEEYLYDKLILLIKNPEKMKKEYGIMEAEELGQLPEDATDAENIENDDLYRVGVIILKLQAVVNDDSDYLDVIRRIIRKPVAEYTDRDKQIISQLLLLAKSPSRLNRTFNEIRHAILNQEPQLNRRQMITEDPRDGSKLIVAIMRVPPNAYRKNNAIASKETREKIIRKLLDDLHKKMKPNATASNEADSSSDSKEVSLKKIIMVDEHSGRPEILDESRRSAAPDLGNTETDVNVLIKSLMNSPDTDGRKSDGGGELSKVIILDEKPTTKDTITNTVQSVLRKFNQGDASSTMESSTTTEKLTSSVTQALSDLIAENMRRSGGHDDKIANTFRTYYDTVEEQYVPAPREEASFFPVENQFIRKLENENENLTPADSEIERTTILNLSEDTWYMPSEYTMTISTTEQPKPVEKKQETQKYIDNFRKFVDDYVENVNKTDDGKENSNESDYGNFNPYIKPLRRFLDIIMHQSEFKEGPSKVFVENNQKTIVNQNLGNATEDQEDQRRQEDGAQSYNQPEHPGDIEMHKEVYPPDTPVDKDMYDMTTSAPFITSLFQRLATPFGSILGGSRRSLGEEDEKDSTKLTTTEKSNTEPPHSSEEKLNEFKTVVKNLKDLAKRRSSDFNDKLKQVFEDGIKQVFENEVEIEDEKRHSSAMTKRKILSTTTELPTEDEQTTKLISTNEIQSSQEQIIDPVRRSYDIEQPRQDYAASTSARVETTEQKGTTNCKDKNVKTEQTTVPNALNSKSHSNQQTEASTAMKVHNCTNELKHNSSHDQDIDVVVLERLRKALQKVDQNFKNNKMNNSIADDDEKADNDIDSQLRRFWKTFRFLMNSDKNNEIQKY